MPDSIMKMAPIDYINARKSMEEFDKNQKDRIEKYGINFVSRQQNTDQDIELGQ